MKTIPNRQVLTAQQKALAPKNSEELYESIHDAIVTALECGAINSGEVLYDKLGIAITLSMEQKLRHAFDTEGYALHFHVMRNGCRRTLIFLDRAPASVV